MTKFSLFGHHPASTGGGGGGGGAVTYDTTAYGTDLVTTAATGWLTFGFIGGSNKQTFVDSVNGLDTNSGLSPNTPVQTHSKGFSVFITGWKPGDQLLFAGGENQEYTDFNTGGNLTVYGGLSLTYPTAILCYDSTDKFNTAKYGKLLGTARPLIHQPTSSSFAMTSEAGTHLNNLVFQGLRFTADNIAGRAIGFTGRHDNIAFQNCLGLGVAFQSDISGSALGFSQNFHMSFCGSAGQWATPRGNTQGVFLASQNNYYVKDNVFFHCAWGLSYSRDDTDANPNGNSYGGATTYGHAGYIHAGCTNGRVGRNVTGDNALDGWGIRGSAVGGQYVSFREPIVQSANNSGNWSEDPSGQVLKIDDAIAFQSGNINSLNIRGSAFYVANCRTGSYYNNIILTNSAQDVTGNSNSALLLFVAQGTPAGQPVQNLTLSNIYAHNWSQQAEQDGQTGGGSTTNLNVVWSNAKLDNLVKYDSSTVTYSTISGTNVRTWVGGDYPNPYDIPDVLAHFSLTKFADLVNMMLSFPHLGWAPDIIGFTAPGYGMTPVYPTPALQSTAGLVPQIIYKNTLNDLTLSAPLTTTAAPKTITSATWAGGVATIQTAAPHNLVSGWYAEIANFTGTPWNTSFAPISVVDATHFTYPIIGNPGTATQIGTYRIAVRLLGASANFTLSSTDTPGYQAGAAISSVTYQPQAGSGAIITSITNSGTTATVQTSTPHNLRGGMVIIMSGASLAANNGSFVVTWIDATHFSYTMASSPGSSPTGGSYTVWCILIITATNHGLSNGNTVTLSGFAPSTWNQAGYPIFVVSATSFWVMAYGGFPGSVPTTVGTYALTPTWIWGTLLGTDGTVGSVGAYHVLETNIDGAGTHTTAI